MSVSDCTYKFEGGDTGVLFVHGLVGSPSEFRYIGQQVARDGHTVHACQLAGHCGTEQDLKATGWKDWLASILDALDELRKVCKTVVVVGSCAGAILAIRAVLERQHQISGLILYSPVIWYDGMSVPRYAHLLKPLMNTPLRHLYVLPNRAPYGIKDQRVRKIVLDAYASGNSAEVGTNGTPADALKQMSELIAQVKPRLGEIRTPAMIIHSREDDAASLRNPAYLQKHLGGIVETVVLDDSYHIITIDRQRQVVAEKTQQFVRQISDKVKMQAAARMAAE